MQTAASQASRNNNFAEPQSRGFVHALRHAVDGILVGVGTVIADNPSLTTRLPEGDGRDPKRIILDTHLSIPLNARVLNQPSDAETILVAGPDVAENARRNIEKKGARILTVATRDGKADWTALMVKLGAEGLASILVEGGSRVCGSALRAGIVDKLYFFYAPKLLAGDDGIPICQGPGRTRMQDCLNVNHITVHRFGQDVMIEGYLDNARNAR